ncbi:hypothetical protein Moror_12083 [Moniliophthora roreri MCA 2997]|uniref:Uncharacterized protein n=1 Tax=Moniliophthora roreri (strain MCA 2997) TaxID=1381753 RepID=V2WTN2_MONRO|nr:hypothetical protein Moror_12083 [Moniliophthora roreri MCA 2997]
MAFFQGSSNFTIQGAHFTNVTGAQHNHIQEDLVQCLHTKKSLRTIWDEYQDIPTGKIYLKRSIGETVVKRAFRRGCSRLEARCIISVARIHGEDRDLEFLHVGYSGRDAFKAFMLDFKQFSHVKNVNIAQLFGYNKSQSGVPALIFYDALIPVAHVFERNQFSSLLYTYFDYQVSITGITDCEVDFGELWIDPKTGALCRGPYMQVSSNRNFWSFLSLQTYSDEESVLQYLAQTLPAHYIIRGLRWCSKITEREVTDEEAASRLSSLHSVIYKSVSCEAIARWPGDVNSLYLGLLEVDSVPHAIRKSKATFNNGTMRFTFTPWNIHDFRWLWLHYGMCPQGDREILMDSWLSQAYHVFNQFGIREDEYGEYSVLRGFWVMIVSDEEEHKVPQTNTYVQFNRPLYLFVRPIPRCSDHKAIWNSWAEKSKCFWSFDSSGLKEMSDDTRASLRLPSLKSIMGVWDHGWDCSAYDAMQKLSAFHGFDPMSTDFAQSLGFSIFEIVGDDDRFHDLEAAYDDEDTEKDPDQADSSDDEIIVYPIRAG